MTGKTLAWRPGSDRRGRGAARAASPAGRESTRRRHAATAPARRIADRRVCFRRPADGATSRAL